MAHILTMPEVLTGATEARLSEWTVIEGDTVAEGDAVAEVETDKAVVDLPTTAPGTVGKLLVAPGATVDVGTPLLVLLADGESLEEVELPEADSGAGATAEAPEPSPGGAGAEAVTERSPVGSPAAELPTSSNVAPSTAAPTNRLFASPLARRLVRERGLDLTSISGSGPQGRITRRDVDRHLDSDGPVLCSGGAPAEVAPSEASDERSEDRLVPHSRMRSAIARRLTESKSTVPHFYLRADCRIDELLALRRELNELPGVRISVNDLVVRAVARAFVAVPEANIRWTEQGTVHLGSIDIAVAVSTEDGLLTPVVRDAATRPVSDLSREIKDLAARSRTGTLRQHELEGGSFTVSNLGMHGTREFGAIINPPQCGILAVGAAERRPVVEGDALAAATMMTVTLSADHRVLDGDLAARWLSAFVDAVESPLSLLL